MTVPHRTPPLAAQSVENAVDLLRTNGLRVSSARRLVIEALFAADRPLTAEEIAAGLEGWLPSSDLASVYRNLDTLEELGLVRHFHVGHGPGRYALASAGELEFVSCEQCGAFEAVPPGRLDGARELIERETGLPRPVLPLPDRRHVRGLPARGEHHPEAGAQACTSLTGSSRTRSRSPARSRRSRRSATACGGPRWTSTTAASRCSASPRRSCSRPRCSTSRSPAARAGTSSEPRSPRCCWGRGSPAWSWPWCCSSRRSCSPTAASRRSGRTCFNMGVIGGVVVGGLMLAARKALPNTRGALLGVTAVGAWLRGHGRRRRLRGRARDLRHRAARHRAAGDARRPHDHRRRRGGRSPSPRSARCSRRGRT